MGVLYLEEFLIFATRNLWERNEEKVAFMMMLGLVGGAHWNLGLIVNASTYEQTTGKLKRWPHK